MGCSCAHLGVRVREIEAKVLALDKLVQTVDTVRIPRASVLTAMDAE